MRYDWNIKESWVHRVMSELGPIFRELGFRPSGRTKYRKKLVEVEFQYLIVTRHPRYSDDTHQVYINPCIKVFFPSLEEATSEVTGKPQRKGYGTLGGSLGLYKDDGYGGNMEEWPIDDEQSALALLPQLEHDIRFVAIPFWDALSSRDKLLQEIDENSKWVQRGDDWKYRLVVLLYLERGIDAAMRFVSDNAKRFRAIDPQALKERLLAL